MDRVSDKWIVFCVEWYTIVFVIDIYIFLEKKLRKKGMVQIIIFPLKNVLNKETL